ncbi:hypothetical protein HNR53_001930 [Bacillus benzoevorans]|uniref:Uncharacterized protein n=1 Tax=Bacillus benzoevorans TaxID=1456 RepID=A0A7X0HQX4_9BACI|nr:hypothetical protein [Bacillus benzoevorans]
MLTNKKRFQLICFTLISTILLIFQPYELTFKNAATDNGTLTSSGSIAQDSRIQQHELQNRYNE